MRIRVHIYAVVLILILMFPPMQQSLTPEQYQFKGFSSVFAFPPFANPNPGQYGIHMPMFLTEIACATLVLAASFIADKRRQP